jgi:hypothetical protein
MTALEFWNEAVMDLGIAINTKTHQDRLELINRAVDLTAGTFYSLLSKNYLTSATIDVIDGRADISNLDMLRSGKEINITLMSDALRRKVLTPLPLEALAGWNGNTFQNRNRAAFSLVGNEIYVAFGTNLTETGCVTLWYPRRPTPVAADSASIDLPNGAPIELGLFKLKRILMERLGMRSENPDNEARRLIKDLYDQIGIIANNRELEKDVRAFI